MKNSSIGCPERKVPDATFGCAALDQLQEVAWPAFIEGLPEIITGGSTSFGLILSFLVQLDGRGSMRASTIGGIHITEAFSWVSIVFESC